eukprot:maker-scaffold_12-snap-gene-10.61-mRNA-1 protein AED:0.01 eAED:0.01 QI:218/1/1/1/0/0/2/63/662
MTILTLRRMSPQEREKIRRHPLRKTLRVMFLLPLAVVLVVSVVSKEMRNSSVNFATAPGTEFTLGSISSPTKNRKLGSSSPRRLFDDEDCIEENPDECADGVCRTDEEVIEGACCIVEFEDENDEIEKDLEDLSVCITLGGEVCPFEDLCVAELIPGSGVGAECLSQFEKDSGVAFYVFLLIYLFFALAIVCDDYFTFALDQLASELGVSSDVKGATFAAIGSSAPELFVSLADNVIANPPKSVGVGTIVGSAIFNILVIIGLSGITAGTKKLTPEQKENGELPGLKLDWKPLVRDSAFYVLSIIGLVVTAVTGDEAEFYEGLILLLVYGGYLWFMKNNQKFMKKLNDFAPAGWKDEKYEVKETEDKKEDTETGAVDLVPVAAAAEKEEEEKEIATLEKAEKEAEGEATSNEEEAAKESEETVEIPTKPRKRKSSIIPKIAEGKLEAERKHSDGYLEEEIHREWNTKEYFSPLIPPGLTPMLLFTVPDARYNIFGTTQGVGDNKKPDKMKLYWLEFTMCILWIAFLSHMLVFSASKFGCLVGIAPSVMGLTILAAGTSVPDAITSVILTRQGEGDAAVANSIGSNVFDILIGLGFPWLLAGFIYGGSLVATDDIFLAVIFLFGVLIVLIGALFVTKFQLNQYLGTFLITLYAAYVIFELARA